MLGRADCRLVSVLIDMRWGMTAAAGRKADGWHPQLQHQRWQAVPRPVSKARSISGNQEGFATKRDAERLLASTSVSIAEK